MNANLADWSARIDVESGALGVSPWPARVSVPLPEVGRSELPRLCVYDASGAPRPTQSRVSTRWPSGAPRWVQVDFQTARTGRHVVRAGDHAPAPRQPVLVERSDDEWRVRVGRLAVTLRPGSVAGVASLAWDDVPLHDAAAPLTFSLHDQAGTAWRLSPSGGAAFEVEAAGPLRWQASVHAAHVNDRGDRLMSARLRFEMLAGVEGLSVSYQFINDQPGHDFVTLGAIEASLSLSALAGDDGRVGVQQNVSTPEWIGRVVRCEGPVTIHHDDAVREPRVADEGVFGDAAAFPWFLKGSTDSTTGAVSLECGQVAVCATMRDLTQQRPKRIDAAPGRWRLGIWPAEAGELALPQGRSSRQVIGLRMFEAGDAAVDRVLGAPAVGDVRPASCWLHADDSAHAGATWCQPHLLAKDEAGAGIFHHLLTQATRRWRTVGEMFNYGDTPDPGYSRTYLGGKAYHEQPRGRYHFADDNSGPHDLMHADESLPPIWTNNEYDAIYCLALEAVRTRDALTLRRMIAAARHQIEVDFVHYSDHWQHHRSTPAHSFDHVTGAATIPSHQWTQGLYYYYCLTGDDDVAEVVRGICDYNLAFLARPEVSQDIAFNRELGWALIALVFGYELTADAKYLDGAQLIVERMQAEALHSQQGGREGVRKSSAGLRPELLGTNFNVNTIPLGLVYFHQVTGSQSVLDMLVEWVRIGNPQFNDRATGVKLSELWTEPMVYVAEQSGDASAVAASRWQVVMLFRGFNAMNWLPASNESLSTKQYTRIYRGLIHYLPALSRHGLLEDLEQRLTDGL